jgi:hypothetical protein
MKYHIYFTGYSDDVVLAGTCKKDLDEHYATFFLLSNGIVVKAAHSGQTGWKIEPTEMPADGVTIIDAVDLKDEGKDHTDERIPEWLDAPGYAPVCIIEADEPLEVVASSDRRSPFSDTSPKFIFAARLRKAILKASDLTDSEDVPSIEAFMQGLRAVMAANDTLQFQREVSKWAQATFPHQTPASKLDHLGEEIAELKANPSDGEEMADCFILLLNLAEMHGHDLMAQARAKMAKNRARKWGKPDERGVCHHIE